MGYTNSQAGMYVLTGSKTIVRNADDGLLAGFNVNNKVRLTLPTWGANKYDMSATLVHENSSSIFITLSSIQTSPAITISKSYNDYAAMVADIHYPISDADRAFVTTTPTSGDIYGAKEVSPTVFDWDVLVPISSWNPTIISSSNWALTFTVGDSIVLIDGDGNYCLATVTAMRYKNLYQVNLYTMKDWRSISEIEFTYVSGSVASIALLNYTGANSQPLNGWTVYNGDATFGGTDIGKSAGVSFAESATESTADISITAKAANALTLGVTDVFTGYDTHYGLTLERVQSAGFSGTPTAGVAIKTVQFTDASEG